MNYVYEVIPVRGENFDRLGFPVRVFEDIHKAIVYVETLLAIGEVPVEDWEEERFYDCSTHYRVYRETNADRYWTYVIAEREVE
jgi:hypothetical protein